MADAQLRRAQLELRVSIDKLHAGSATRSDSLRSTVDYGNAQIALLQAQANLATAQTNLGRQIGVDQAVRALPDSVFPAMPDTAALRAAAIEQAPQVRQADAQASAARAGTWTNRSQYFPTLTLSYGGNRQDTIFANALTSASAFRCFATRMLCCASSIGRKFPSTPTLPKTTSAPSSQNGKSPAEPSATQAATSVTSCWDWQKHA